MGPKFPTKLLLPFCADWSIFKWSCCCRLVSGKFPWSCEHVAHLSMEGSAAWEVVGSKLNVFLLNSHLTGTLLKFTPFRLFLCWVSLPTVSQFLTSTQRSAWLLSAWLLSPARWALAEGFMRNNSTKASHFLYRSCCFPLICYRCITHKHSLTKGSKEKCKSVISFYLQHWSAHEKLRRI